MEAIKKNIHLIVLATFLISLLGFAKSCSNGNDISKMKNQQTELIEKINKTNSSVEQLELVMPQLIQREFTQNLVYQSEIQSGKMSNKQIQDKLNNLNSKILDIKNKK